MSYEPTNWKTGDVVTSAKLNKLENGVVNAGGGSGVLFVHIDQDAPDHWTTDKTYAEILAAYESGVECFAMFPGDPVVSIGKDEGYPELYGLANECYSDGQGGGILASYYFEFSESGLSVTESRYTLTETN